MNMKKVMRVWYITSDGNGVIGWSMMILDLWPKRGTDMPFKTHHGLSNWYTAHRVVKERSRTFRLGNLDIPSLESMVNFQTFVYIVSISGYTPLTIETFSTPSFFGVFGQQKRHLLWRRTLQTAEIHVDVSPPGSSICITEAQLQLDDPWARTQQKGGSVWKFIPTWPNLSFLANFMICPDAVRVFMFVVNTSFAQAQAPPSWSG